MTEDLKKLTSGCSCGKKHSLSTRDIFVGAGATQKLIDYIKDKYDATSALIVCDANTEKYARPLADALGCRTFTHVADARANEIETARLTSYIKSNSLKVSVAVACGSGCIHDITRYCAYENGFPFISYPTAASVDGFVSGVAAMTMHGQKLTYPSASPDALFADDDVYSEAPRRLTASGVGDIIGKFTALFDWEIAHMIIGEHLCPEIASLMRQALNGVYNAASEVGGADSKDFPRRVMDCLILSGLAMQLMGNSRPASGAEHHMAHFWEMHVANPPTDALHGEKVGVATIHVLRRLEALRNSHLPQIDIDIAHVFDKNRVQSIYGELTDGIIKENLPGGKNEYSSSVLYNISPDCLIKNEKQTMELLAGLPSSEEITRVLHGCGAPTTLGEIDLPQDKPFEDVSAIYSPYVRNRLTLMKIISANLVTRGEV